MTDKIETNTRSQQQAVEVSALIRARNQLLWVVSREEPRVESYLFNAALAAGYKPFTWDVAQGIADLSGASVPAFGRDTQDPGEALKLIAKLADQPNGGCSVWIMRDLPAWLTGPAGVTTMRQLRNIARNVVPREQAQCVIVLSPSAEVPPELAGHAVVIEWPLPDRDEIADILDVLISQYELTDMLKNGKRNAAIDAAVGLSGEEAQACYSKSLVQFKMIEPAAVAKEKKRVIARERVLEWHDPLPDGLNSVGGLENLKKWLLSRSDAYTPEARAYGLPSPRGALVVGISGCGKSLLCKATATMWQIPLLRLDLGALKSKYVGASETNLRKALSVVESVGRCVLWIDEIEKALQGATSGSADGGVAADALGALLVWMQERQGDAFIIATANDVSALPPEFLRKGRFDEMWFVDLPNSQERVEVLRAALRTYKRGDAKIDAKKVAAECVGFTGAEIAAIVPDALFAAYADKQREITTDDLIDAARTVVPLSKTADKKIESMREWAKGKTRPASAAEKIVERKKMPALDLA